MRHLSAICFLVLFATGACSSGHELPEVECDDVPEFKDVKAFDVCTDCHSSKLEAGERNGAPNGVNYDKYEDAVIHAEHGVEEVYEGLMPPGGGLKLDEEEDFYKWGLCGTPE